MAKTIDIELQKQLDKPQAWFCKYFPARIRNVSEREIADRKLVFDFKDGRAYEEVAQRTAANMTEQSSEKPMLVIRSELPFRSGWMTNRTSLKKGMYALELPAHPVSSSLKKAILMVSYFFRHSKQMNIPFLSSAPGFSNRRLPGE